MRLLDLLRKSTQYLEAADIEDALPDAEMLVFDAVKMDRLDAYVNNPEVTSTDSAKVRKLLQRRAKGEPVQYIIGHIEFLGLTINVGKGVLIPRPETELLAEEAIRAVGSQEAAVKNKTTSLFSCLDICTGSGCIALALAKAFPGAAIYGTDLSKEALSFAKKNAKANDLENAMFLQGSLFEPVKGMTFDLITANPPYVRRDEIETLQPEIRDWEPVAALDGGQDGMDFYRAILSSAGDYLAPGGRAFLELGYDQAEDVKKIAKRKRFNDVAVINDYAGIGRILTVRR